MRIYILSLLFISQVFFAFSSEGRKNRKKELVEIETNYGIIKVKLYDETPIHKENFLKLVEEGFYDDLLFHRVINQFMIQGGDPDSRDADSAAALGNGGPGYTLEAEIVEGLFHKKGALAAARKGDMQNPEKRSNGSQFYLVQGKVFTVENLKMMEKQMNNQIRQQLFRNFLGNPENQSYQERLMKLQADGDNAGIQTLMQEIEPIIEAQLEEKGKFSFSEAQIEAYTTQGGAPHLDGGYTVFGEIIEGLDVLDKIASVQTNRQNRPLEDVTIKLKLVKK